MGELAESKEAASKEAESKEGVPDRGSGAEELEGANLPPPRSPSPGDQAIEKSGRCAHRALGCLYSSPLRKRQSRTRARDPVATHGEAESSRFETHGQVVAQKPATLCDKHHPMASTGEPVDPKSPCGDVGHGTEHGLTALVALTRSLATEHDIHDILFLVVSRLAALLHVDRGSIVLLGDVAGSGSVVATSDDAEIRNLPIELEKYPEIRQVLDSGSPLVIDEVSSSPLLHDVLREEGPIDFVSMALLPIIGEKGPLAVLCLKGRSRVRFSDFDLLQAEAVANATAISLNNAHILSRLKDESIGHARRMRELGRYLDFFESSADAMLVMDRAGVVLFANPTAALLTGISASALVGMTLDQLVARSAGRLAKEVIAGFPEGRYPVGVDFPLNPGAGPSRLACVNFSLVVRETDAVLATMRDVTRERELAHELAQTKEFLERVIESSVDSIVSADLRGNVLLFNRAASRLFGYEQGEVLGRLNVERLYPGGVARDIMRRIRGNEYGGKGRLEDHRVDMLTKSGELLTVTLSASFVMDGAKPVGTLGIFTDIREKLAMEGRLARAQHELAQHEKQSAIAELAGAAAHELNQPLTSIMGYAEYLKRAISSDPQLDRAISVIQSETERMAEIVRKVGRITRYETKPYVGESKIVDLDRSSRTDNEEPELP